MPMGDLVAGERIFLHLPDGTALPTRLQAIDADGLVIEPPMVPQESMPLVDDEIEVQWFRPRGRYELVTVLGQVYKVDGRWRWELVPIEDPVLRQERRYVRGPGGQCATVVTQAGQRLDGRVVDLAELSIRVRLCGPPPAAPEQVLVEFKVGDEPIRARAEVVRTSPVCGPAEVDVVMMLDVTPAQADHLRAFIFEQQRRELRTANS